jgi:hypothetical protein
VLLVAVLLLTVLLVQLVLMLRMNRRQMGVRAAFTYVGHR